MSNSKSKFPDLKELTAMAGKFFNDIKHSVTEIIADYKKKRDLSTTSEVVSSSKPKTTTKTAHKPKSKTAEPSVTNKKPRTSAKNHSEEKSSKKENKD